MLSVAIIAACIAYLVLLFYFARHLLNFRIDDHSDEWMD